MHNGLIFVPTQHTPAVLRAAHAQRSDLRRTLYPVPPPYSSVPLTPSEMT